MTEQSMVLLKNEDNLLPIKPGKTIAVVGPHANATIDMLANYLGQICPKEDDYGCIVSPYLAIQCLNVGGKTYYSQGCTVTGSSTDGFPAAVAAARQADYVVMVLGLNQDVEREGHDRTTIGLPGVQFQFSQTITGVGKPTILVMINGGAVAIAWEQQNIPAIIEASYPGFQGGVAIANTIFGKNNPGGKLPVTYYPLDYVNEVNFESMSMTTAPGRSYKYYTGATLWPFGFGLSYTQFNMTWSSLLQNPQVLMIGDRNSFVTYTVKVTNVGTVTGDEVVQAYYTPSNVQLPQGPLIKQLFGFQRVHLKPNESATLKFEFNGLTGIQMTDADGNTLVVPGVYKVMFTNGVDLVLEASLILKGQKLLIEKFPSAK